MIILLFQIDIIEVFIKLEEIVMMLFIIKYMVQKIGKNGSYKQCSDTENCGYVMRSPNAKKVDDGE